MFLKNMAQQYLVIWLNIFGAKNATGLVLRYVFHLTRKHYHYLLSNL